jgi:hypothetical protein
MIIEARSIIEVIILNLILYYLCAESTGTRTITDTAQRRYIYKYIMDIIILMTMMLVIIKGKVFLCA